MAMTQARKFKCYDCRHAWEVPYGTGRPEKCPNCESVNIHRAEAIAAMSDPEVADNGMQ